MSVRREDIKAYCKPFLERNTFRFSQIAGLLDKKLLVDLECARSVVDGRQDPVKVLEEFRKVFEETGSPTNKIFESPRLNCLLDSPSPEKTFQLHQILRSVFMMSGVYISPENPKVGLLLHRKELEGLPINFFLAEPVRPKMETGIFFFMPEGDSSVDINVTENIARLARTLDYWLVAEASLPTRKDGFHIMLYNTPRENLLRIISRSMSKLGIRHETIPSRLALEVSCNRLMIKRLANIASASSNPRQFLCHSLNIYLDSALARQMGHIEERLALRSIPLPGPTKTAVSYLLQAIYGDPADAFRTLLARGYDLAHAVPELEDDLRSLGPESFCVDSEFLRNWAREIVDRIFIEATDGRTHDVLIEKHLLVDSQTTDHIRMPDMPLIERSMYNPNIKAKR